MKTIKTATQAFMQDLDNPKHVFQFVLKLK